VNTAASAAQQLKSMGTLSVIAMGPNVNATDLNVLSSGAQNLFAWPDYIHPPDDLMTNITNALGN
jgi:hypothetical protein